MLCFPLVLSYYQWIALFLQHFNDPTACDGEGERSACWYTPGYHPECTGIYTTFRQLRRCCSHLFLPNFTGLIFCSRVNQGTSCFVHNLQVSFALYNSLLSFYSIYGSNASWQSATEMQSVDALPSDYLFPNLTYFLFYSDFFMNCLLLLLFLAQRYFH